MAIKKTAGQDALGSVAPKFAQLNGDVLFGEVGCEPVSAKAYGKL